MSAFLVFPLVALVLSLFLAGGLIALIAHRRTRMAGIGVLLALPLVAVILAIAGYVMLAPLVMEPAVDSLPPRLGMVLREGLPHPGQPIPSWSLATGKATQGPHTQAEVEEPPPAPPGPLHAEAAEVPMGAEAPDAQMGQAAASKPAAATSASRPEWVGASPRRTQDGYQVSVATDPFATPLECQRQLPEVVRQAVAQYVALYLGDEALAAQIELPLEFLLREVVRAQWEEAYESSVGPMVRLHALLVFDGKCNARIDEAAHQRLVQHRVGRLGLILAGVLALLAAAWAYLRLDLATGGRYRWRLRLAAGAAILGVVAAGWAMLA